jgi:hypothetical protein
LVAALGQAQAHGTLPDYGGDALRWLRRFFNDFEHNANIMEIVTLQETAISSTKYKEAHKKLHLSSIAAGEPDVLRTFLVFGLKSYVTSGVKPR